MLRHHKLHCSDRNTAVPTTNSKRKKSNQTLHVKNFMQSIDPSRKKSNHHIPSSPQLDNTSRITFAASSKTTPSLPFFPEPDSFGSEPPLRTPPSLIRRNKKKQSLPSPSISSLSNASSLVSSPPQSSGFFYSSNRSRLKTNFIKVVPFPRKILFLSPKRTNASNDSSQIDHESGSLLKEISHNTYSNVVPFHHRHQANKPTTMSGGSSNENNNKHWIDIKNFSSRYGTANDGIFEDDSPAMGSKTSQFLFHSPRTPESVMEMKMRNLPVLSTPTKRQQFDCFTRTPVAPAIVNNPWHTPFLPTGLSTPKRVSLDTGNKSPLTLPNDNSMSQVIIPAPILRLQPSMGTTMAASVLMSLMVVEQRGSSKRTPGFDGSSSPTKKFKMTPLRISNLVNEGPSTQNVVQKADGENCEALSNRSGHSLLFHKPKEKRPVLGQNEERKDSNKLAICKSSGNMTEQSPPTSVPISSSLLANSLFKRIPRRFIDDPRLPVLKSGMRLAAPNDPDELNSLHCFVRSELLEVFVVEDSRGALAESTCFPCKKSPRKLQRVGIRCIHCGAKPKRERAGTSMSAFYPKSIQDIYRGVCTWQRIHSKACKHIPKNLKDRYKVLKEGDRSRGKKAHWVKSALEMGLRNVNENRNGVIWIGSVDATVASESEQDLAPRTSAVSRDLTILENTTTASRDNDSREDNVVVLT